MASWYTLENPTMSASTPVLNPETNRYVLYGGKTYRSLLARGVLCVADDPLFIAYINHVPEREIRDLKKFYKESNCDYTAVFGRGCYKNCLVKRQKQIGARDVESRENFFLH